VNLLEDVVFYANSKKIKVGLNPGKKELEEKKTLLSLLPKIEYLNLNYMEATQFWGGKYPDPGLRTGGEDKKMAKRFLEKGVRLVTITDGRKGAGIGGGDRWIKSEAYKTKSIDDTGAGDAFTSGVVAGWLEEKDLEEVLRMGLSNGASVVTGLGAKDFLIKSEWSLEAISELIRERLRE